MNITKNKIKIIFALSFLMILKKLNYFLNFIDWLCFNISRYFQWIKFLQKRKTLLNKNLTKDFKQVRQMNSTKVVDKQTWKTLTIKRVLKNFIQQEFNSFKDVQSAFEKNTFLVHFSSIKQLFIDVNAFKESGFAIMTYHFKFTSSFFTDEKYINTSSCIDVQSIFFMNKFLNLAKKNYWSIELKMTAVVWIMKKFRHMIKSISQIMIIYIDHVVNIFITRQTSFTTSFTNKLNLCLIQAL